MYFDEKCCEIYSFGPVRVIKIFICKLKSSTEENNLVTVGRISVFVWIFYPNRMFWIFLCAFKNYKNKLFF